MKVLGVELCPSASVLVCKAVQSSCSLLIVQYHWECSYEENIS